MAGMKNAVLWVYHSDPVNDTCKLLYKWQELYDTVRSYDNAYGISIVDHLATSFNRMRNINVRTIQPLTCYRNAVRF
jgi:hypothetical protein